MACSTWCASTCNSTCNGNCSSYCSASGTTPGDKNRGTNETRTQSGENGKCEVSCSCGNNCSNECSSCHRSCTGGCSGSSTSVTSSCSTCGSSCENNCATNCQGSCKSGCTGTCQDTCSGKCTGSCQTECNYGCISTSAMLSYRNLKLTEYINSSNILVIYRFIQNELNRLGKPLNTNNIKEEDFRQNNYVLSEVINTLIEAMNNVTINSTNNPELTTEQKLFTGDSVLNTVDRNETYIDSDLGQQIIENAKTLFNVKIAVD